MPRQQPPVKHTQKRASLASDRVSSGHDTSSGQIIPVTENNPQANDTVSIFHEQPQTLIKHYAHYRGKLLKAVIDDDAKTLEDLQCDTTTINHFLDALSHASDYHAMGESTLCQYINNSIACQVLTGMTEERIDWLQRHKSSRKSARALTNFKRIRETAFSTISALCNQHPSTQAIEIRIAAIKATIIRTDDNCEQLGQLLMEHKWVWLNQFLIKLKQGYQEGSERLNVLYKANQALIGQSKLAVEQEKQSVTERGILGLQWADGRTLLHYAAEENSKQVVIFLISQDSQLLFKADAQGNRPLAMLLKNTDEEFVEQVSSTALKAVSPQTLIDAVEEKSHERFSVLKENIASLLKGAEHIAKNDHTLISNPETWEEFLYYTMFEKNYKALMQYRREEFSLFLHGLHDLLADYDFDKFSGALRKIMYRKVLGPVPEDRDNWRNRRNFHTRIEKLYLSMRQTIEENAELYADHRVQLVTQGIIRAGAMMQLVDKDAVQLYAGESIALSQKVSALGTLLLEEQKSRTEAESQNKILIQKTLEVASLNKKLDESYASFKTEQADKCRDYMEVINEFRQYADKQDDVIKERDNAIQERDDQLLERKNLINEKIKAIGELDKQLEEKDIEITDLRKRFKDIEKREEKETNAATNPNAFRYSSKGRSSDSENINPESKHQLASPQG